jgi:hypothetical protein
MRSFAIGVLATCFSCAVVGIAAGQLQLGPRSPSHVVRNEPIGGQRDLFAGQWDSVTGSTVMPSPPDSLTALRLALVATMIGSIAPAGQQVESCRQYSLIVQGPRHDDRRVIFVLGDAREPRSFRFARGADRLSATVFFEAADCLTYAMVAAHEVPAVRQYAVDVRPDTVTTRILSK